MTAANARTLCCRACPVPDAGAAVSRAPGVHHDRLLAVDTDVDALLALLETAVTWYELDYSDCDVVGPAAWSTFAQNHEWRHPERAERAFSLAMDIVGRAIACPSPEPVLAAVIDLVRS